MPSPVLNILVAEKRLPYQCHVFQYHGLNTMEWIIQTLRLPHYYELHTML